MSSSTSTSSSYSSSNQSSGGDHSSGSVSDDNGEVTSSYCHLKQDAKQDPRLNNKHRGIIITEQMDEDRISYLPYDIIHHILSFLDMKYGIQTTTLSKKWKNIWTSMPHLNLNSRAFRSWPRFAKFVNDALSHRNHRTEVSAIELSFSGVATHFDAVVTNIVNYAYSHNVRQLTLLWFRFNNEVLELFPQRLFNSHTLKDLTLATNYLNGCGLSVPESSWDFPALETLHLSNMRFGDDFGDDKSLNLFSKCVNLKDLTLHGYDMWGLDIFNVCVPQLSNLTITDPYRFPKVFNVVAPKLENLTAFVMDTSLNFLQLSTEELNSLDKVNLSMQEYISRKERYAPGLQDLFQKLCTAKFLILDNGIIEVLSACLDQLSNEPCPFNNLKCLKQKDPIPRMPTQVRNYFLESFPTITFIMDLPQKRSREEVDKRTTAKKALSSCTNRISHKASPFNNLKCLNQTDPIPRMSTEIKNQLPESSPSATFNMDIPRVPHKRSRHEADNGTTANTLEEKEKQQTKIMDEKKRMLEAKIHVQDEIIAQQKKVMHEHGMLEEIMLMQDKVIAEQKAMLETMKLKNEKKMFEAKIERQHKIIARQNAMLEAMKLHIETDPGDIDS